jgi:hypothetical protein
MRANLLLEAAKVAGLKIYESGLVCVRCGKYTRYVSSNACVTCQRAYGASRRVKPATDFPHLARSRGEAAARGDLLWWPGKRCQFQHVSPRFTADNRCQACVVWGGQRVTVPRAIPQSKLDRGAQRLEDERAVQLAAQMVGMAVYDNPYPCNACGAFQRYAADRTCVPCTEARHSPSRAKALRALPRSRADAIELGEAYFFPRRKCPRGHVAKRSVTTNGCYDCAHPRRK